MGAGVVAVDWCLLRMEAELRRWSIGHYMVRFRVRMSSYLVMGTRARSGLVERGPAGSLEDENVTDLNLNSKSGRAKPSHVWLVS